MTTETKVTPEDDARTRFLADHEASELTVLHDDGLYRHLRVANPTGSTFDHRFDIITWPGRLTLDGVHGCWTFTRVEDMFEFFRDNPDRPRINPHYWAEKLINGVSGGRVEAQEYDEDRWREHVTSRASEDWSGWDGPAGEALRADVEKRLLDKGDWDYPGAHEESARERVNGYRFEWCRDCDPAATYPHKRDHDVDRFEFTDTWEWDLKGYSFHFLWSCWAIVHGIRLYDQEVGE